MKKNFFLILLVAISFASCKHDEFKDVGIHSSKTALLKGTWKVTTVVQQDLNAIEDNFPYMELDVTSLAGFTSSTLMLNTDALGNPTTFTVDKGTAPFFIPLTSGDWTVDNIGTPSTIKLGTTPNTVDVQLMNYTSLYNNKLDIRVFKKAAGKNVMAYKYQLTKN